MKYCLRYVGLIFTCLLVGCSDHKPLEERSLIEGLEEFRGHWILVNYWAEWCAPCREEIPEFNEMFHERAETNVYVLGVNFDGIRGLELEELMEKMDIEFPQLIKDPSAALNTTTPEILPTTFVINPSGSLVSSMVGPQTTASLKAAIGL